MFAVMGVHSMTDLGPGLNKLPAELAQSHVSMIAFEELQMLTVRHSISVTFALLSAML